MLSNLFLHFTDLWWLKFNQISIYRDNVIQLRYMDKIISHGSWHFFIHLCNPNSRTLSCRFGIITGYSQRTVTMFVWRTDLKQCYVYMHVLTKQIRHFREENRRKICTSFLYCLSGSSSDKQCIMSKMFFHLRCAVTGFSHSNHMYHFYLFPVIFFSCFCHCICENDRFCAGMRYNDTISGMDVGYCFFCRTDFLFIYFFPVHKNSPFLAEPITTDFSYKPGKRNT